MVDLRASLRPLVEEPTRDRLPVAELADRATRARQRRLRRRSAIAGVAAVVVVGVGGSLVTRDDPDQVTTRGSGPDTPVTTADPPPTTAAPPGPTTPSTTITGPPPPPPPTTTPPRPTTTPAPSATGTGPDGESDGPVGNDPALVVTTTTTSDWENGHCVEHRVDNTGDHPVTWTVELTPAGAIDTMWNTRVVAEDGPRRTFAGEDWNATIAPGAWTTFGTCLAT